MKYQHLLDELASAHDQLYALVKDVSVEKSQEILFDKWSLHDVLVHLTAWNTIGAANLLDLMKDSEPTYHGSVNEFNTLSTTAGKNLSWEDVLCAFDDSGKYLVEAYKKLPESLYEEKFWKNKSATPAKYLKIYAEHYTEEHLPRIQEESENLGI